MPRAQPDVRGLEYTKSIGEDLADETAHIIFVIDHEDRLIPVGSSTGSTGPTCESSKSGSAMTKPASTMESSLTTVYRRSTSERRVERGGGGVEGAPAVAAGGRGGGGIRAERRRRRTGGNAAGRACPALRQTLGTGRANKMPSLAFERIRLLMVRSITSGVQMYANTVFWVRNSI